MLQQRAAAASCKQSRRSERQRAACGQGSCKVQKPRRTHRKKLGLYHVSRHAPWRFGITSRARATLGITAARAFPHAGRWESLATRAGTGCWNLGRVPEPHSGLNSATEYPRTHYRTNSVHTSVSRITVTCRVRNNRIICQSSDPLEGMAITLNQWILLTARAIQSDDVAPNAPPHTPPAVAGRGRAHSALTCVPASLTQKTDERR